MKFINAKLKAHKRLLPNQSENDAIEDLIQLLNPQVQVHLLQTPHNIDDLLLKLEVIDKARKIEPDRSKSTAKPEKTENPKPYATSDSKPAFLRPYPFNSPFPDDKKNPPRYTDFVPNCRFCPERHFHKDCPVFQKMRERREVNSTPNKQTHAPTSPNYNEIPQPKPGSPKWNNKSANSYQSPSPQSNPLPAKPHASQVNSPYVSPSICINIFDKYQPVMLDSGASNCFIEEKALPPNTLTHPCYDVDVMDIRGNVVNVIGQTPLHFTLGKHEYTEDFRIIRDFSSHNHRNGMV